jgi:hypothetical protein
MRRAPSYKLRNFQGFVEDSSRSYAKWLEFKYWVDGEVKVRVKVKGRRQGKVRVKVKGAGRLQAGKRLMARRHGPRKHAVALPRFVFIGVHSGFPSARESTRPFDKLRAPSLPRGSRSQPQADSDSVFPGTAGPSRALAALRGFLLFWSPLAHARGHRPKPIRNDPCRALPDLRPLRPSVKTPWWGRMAISDCRDENRSCADGADHRER